MLRVPKKPIALGPLCWMAMSSWRARKEGVGVSCPPLGIRTRAGKPGDAHSACCWLHGWPRKCAN